MEYRYELAISFLSNDNDNQRKNYLESLSDDDFESLYKILSSSELCKNEAIRRSIESRDQKLMEVLNN